MSDAYWGAIKDEKIDVLDNMMKFCEEFGIEMPECSTSMSLEALTKISRDLRTNFWSGKIPRLRKIDF